jgi:hypothetical protein
MTRPGARSLLAFIGALAISPVAGNAAESPPFRHDAAAMVMMMDEPRDTKCARRKIVKTEPIESSPPVERWTLDRCGKLVNYRVRFTPNPKGGTDLDVQLEK